MKKITITALLLMTCSLFASIKSVSTNDLKNLKISDSSLVIIDARTTQWFKGEIIQGAIWLPSDSSDETILAALPSKDATIVTYCFSESCPLAGHLAERLVKMGYKNVSEYSAGFKEWKSEQLPVRSY